MYTLVLAAFLTTGNEVPDWGRRGGCHGCWGGCHGCWGGCYGCRGGCFGCYGCWGGCFGCYGCWGGCFGCYGCSGGCFGCYGCCGGCGGMVVVPATTAPVTQGIAPAATAPVTQGTATQAQAAQTLDDLKKSIEELKKEQSELRKAVEELRRSKARSERPDPQRGKLLLEMPADALVLVNDKPIAAEAAYLTPPLEPGKEQVLNVETALVRDGKSINRFKRLALRGGEVVRLAYEDMESVEGGWTRAGEHFSSPARITVHLPADARLTVHGVACPLTSDTRTFDTPALEPGQKYYYLLKAEVVRNGRTLAQTKRVAFRSGERVTVSFADLGTNLVTAR